MWFGTKIVNFDYVTKSKLNNLNVLCYKIYCKKKTCLFHQESSKPTAWAHNESVFQRVCLHCLLTYFFCREGKFVFLRQPSDSSPELRFWELGLPLKKRYFYTILPSSRCQIMPAFWPINTCSIMKLIKWLMKSE